MNLDFRPFNKEHAVIIKGLKSKSGKMVQNTIVANIKRGYAVLEKVSADLERAAGF